MNTIFIISSTFIFFSSLASGAASSSTVTMPTSSASPPSDNAYHLPYPEEQSVDQRMKNELIFFSLFSYEDLERRPVTREMMAAYSATRRHRTVTIHHAKVAQKPYGNEKR